MHATPERTKRTASQRERRQSYSSPRPQKRQKVTGTYSLLSLAKESLFDPLMKLVTPAKEQRPAADQLPRHEMQQVEPMPRIAWAAPALTPSAVVPPPKSAQTTSSNSLSRQQPINSHSALHSTPQKPTGSGSSAPQNRPGKTLTAREALLLRAQQLRQQHAPVVQPPPLSPITIDSEGQWQSLSGATLAGGGAVQSTPRAADGSSRLVNSRSATNGRASNEVYHKKRPIGAKKHQQLLATRDHLDLHALKSEQHSQSSASSPSQAPQPLPPLSDSLQPPPEPQEGTRSDLQRRLQSLPGYFTASTAVGHAARKELNAALKHGNRSYTSVEQALANAKRVSETPASASHKKWDQIRAKRLQEELLLDKKPTLRRRFPKQLQPHEQDIVDRAMANRAFHAELVGAEVSARDLARMRRGTWLNDEVITFFSVLVNDRARPVRDGTAVPAKDAELNLRAVWCFNHAWYGKLCASGHAGVQRWTKKVPDVFKLDALIAPINLGNSHWVCAAINFPKKRIEYYDSLGGRNANVFDILRDYLVAEDAKMRKKDPNRSPFNLDEWSDLHDPDVPQQLNSCDCGVFTCQFMESLSRDSGQFDFEQHNMPYLRNKMVLEIVKKELIVEPWEK